ncbi:hypothetical protein MMC29_002836 [Sticta canariensis]|nr:hypothetical protein [Sticta canariensis]
MELYARWHNVPNQGPSILAVSIVFVSLSGLAVGTRLVRRLCMVGGGMGVDDWLISFALTMAVGHSIGDISSVAAYGYGKHEADLPSNMRGSHQADLLFWISQILYKSCVLTTKESILFLYLRLFTVGHPRFRRAVYIAISIVALYYTISIIITIFECRPVARSWDKATPGTCMNIGIFFYANASFNVASDLIVMGLPVPVIAKLQLAKKTRIGLGFLFFIGTIATVASVVRFFTLQQGGKIHDISWTTSKSTIWSCVEINLAILCACLPILRVPLQTLLPRVFGHRSTDHTSSAATNNTITTFVSPPTVAGSGGWSRISHHYHHRGKDANTGVERVQLADLSRKAEEGGASEDDRRLVVDEGRIVRTTDFMVDYGAPRRT